MASDAARTLPIPSTASRIIVATRSPLRREVQIRAAAGDGATQGRDGSFAARRRTLAAAVDAPFLARALARLFRVLIVCSSAASRAATSSVKAGFPIVRKRRRRRFFYFRHRVIESAAPSKKLRRGRRVQVLSSSSSDDQP